MEQEDRPFGPPGEEVPEPGSGGPAGSGGPGEGGARAFMADAVRKAVLTGLGAVFLTEEGARKLARDWKLPREVVGYFAQQAGGAKDEIVRVVTEEVRKFFESPALRRELIRMLSSMSIEIQAEVRLKPARGGKKAEADVKLVGLKPRVKHRGAGEEPSDE